MALLDRPEGRLAIALGIGLVIGAERERRKGEGPTRTAAGLRTFALAALLGGVAGVLGSNALVIVLATIVGAFALAGYVLGDRSDPGLTTELALVLTYALGALATREPKLALAAALCAATLLAFRARLHAAVRSVLTEDEMHDALLFGVAALVVLPLLPNRVLGPLGVVNLFVLWRLAVVMMAMSGAGYVAQRVIGPRYGLALAGFGSGLVSSTATIAAFGARAREDESILHPAVAGAAASTAATYLLLSIFVGTANPALLRALAFPLGAGGLVALGYAALQTFRARRAEATPIAGRAFKLSVAIGFAVLVTMFSFVSALARRWLGAAGAIAAAALAGFADAHAASAAVASVARSGRVGQLGAQIAVLLALTTNALTKIVVASTSGPRRYSVRVIVGVVLALIATWGAEVLGLALT